jgi:hypothetical protein
LNLKLINYLLWALIVAEGLCAITAVAIRLLGFPWRGTLGDALFLEGAVLFIVVGLIDMGRSITFGRIRALRKSSFGDPPPEIKKPGRSYMLLLAGLVLFLQGGLLAYSGI